MYIRTYAHIRTHYVSIHYLRYGRTYCVCDDNSSTFGDMPSTLGVNCKESSSNVPKCYLASSSSYLFRVWLAVVLLLFFRASQCEAEYGFLKQRFRSIAVLARVSLQHITANAQSSSRSAHIATKAGVSNFLRRYDKT